jgi:hypothetical protein
MSKLGKGLTPLFEAYTGSYVYGTYIEGQSDKDIKGVYIQDHLDVCSFDYKEFIEINKDETWWEIKRFVELLDKNNPTALELIYTPEEFIIYEHPSFKILRDRRDEFLSKICQNSFANYAHTQIKKASGTDKKMNWEKERIERKTPIDFVRLYDDNSGTISLKTYLYDNNLKQENCGLSKVSNARETYALFYSESIPYKGVEKPNSNDIRLSEIPKGEKPIGLAIYNKDAYTIHCKEYKEYQEWLNKRNETRYVDTLSHGQKYDGKNLLHCVRLIEVAMEIAIEKKVNVIRKNSDYLLQIKKGNATLKQVLETSEKLLNNLHYLYDMSNLPDKPDRNLLNNLLKDVRRSFEKN